MPEQAQAQEKAKRWHAKQMERLIHAGVAHSFLARFFHQLLERVSSTAEKADAFESEPLPPSE